MLAVRLMTQIEQEFSIQLPLAALFQHNTIEQLATELRQQSESTVWSSAVAIQSEGDKTPLFCVHPVGGNVLCYFELAQYLGKEHPFYGLQAYGLEAGQTPYTQVIDMAAFYLQAIQSIQPHGPYQLAGWSFGGLVAFEVASQLQAQGESVSFLALLDTVAPSVLESHQVPDDAQLLIEFLQGEEVCFSQDHLRRLSEEEQLHYMIKQGKQSGLFPADIDLGRAQRIMQVYKTNVSALHSYRTQPYRGRVTLFQAKEGAVNMTSKPDLGWGEYASLGVEIIQSPGSHQNMVKLPHVQTLAEQLGGHLE